MAKITQLRLSAGLENWL